MNLNSTVYNFWPSFFFIQTTSYTTLVKCKLHITTLFDTTADMRRGEYKKDFECDKSNCFTASSREKHLCTLSLDGVM